MSIVLEQRVETVQQVAIQALNLTPEQIAARIKDLQNLLPKKEPKETPLYILERRGFSESVKNDLFNFGAVQRAANKLLNKEGVEGFEKKLTDKQKAAFVPVRLAAAVKSKTMLLKVTNKGIDIQALTPSKYLNLIASFCTLSQKEFDKRRTAK